MISFSKLLETLYEQLNKTTLNTDHIAIEIRTDNTKIVNGIRKYQLKIIIHHPVKYNNMDMEYLFEYVAQTLDSVPESALYTAIQNVRDYWEAQTKIPKNPEGVNAFFKEMSKYLDPHYFPFQ